jgi:hypothetical protein
LESKRIAIYALIAVFIIDLYVIFIDRRDFMVMPLMNIAIVPNCIGVITKRRKGFHAVFSGLNLLLLFFALYELLHFRFDFKFYVAILSVFNSIALETILIILRKANKKEFEPWDDIEKYNQGIDTALSVMLSIFFFCIAIEFFSQDSYAFRHTAYFSEQFMILVTFFGFSAVILVYILAKIFFRVKSTFILKFIRIVVETFKDENIK